MFFNLALFFLLLCSFSTTLNACPHNDSESFGGNGNVDERDDNFRQNLAKHFDSLKNLSCTVKQQLRATHGNFVGNLNKTADEFHEHTKKILNNSTAIEAFKNIMDRMKDWEIHRIESFLGNQTDETVKAVIQNYLHNVVENDSMTIEAKCEGRINLLNQLPVEIGHQFIRNLTVMVRHLNVSCGPNPAMLGAQNWGQEQNNSSAHQQMPLAAKADAHELCTHIHQLSKHMHHHFGNCENEEEKMGQPRQQQQAHQMME